MTDSQRKRDEEAESNYRRNDKSWMDSDLWTHESAFIAGIKHCRDTEVKELRELCDKMSLNSLKIEIERDEFREQLRVAVEALAYISWPGYERDHWNRVNRAKEALQKIEAMKGGKDG